MDIYFLQIILILKNLNDQNKALTLEIKNFKKLSSKNKYLRNLFYQVIHKFQNLS